MRKIIAFIVVIVFFGGCDRHSVEPQVQGFAVEPTVWLSPAKLHMTVGQTIQISATISDSAGNILEWQLEKPDIEVGSIAKSIATIADKVGRSGGILSWSSSHPSLASVDNKGMVTAIASGAAVITATFAGKERRVEVVVLDPEAETLSTSPKYVSLMVGESLQLKAITHSEDADVLLKPISWEVNNREKATVTSSGFLTAKSSGLVTITAKAAGNSGTTFVDIKPVKLINGLDFPGSASVNTTMRFEFKEPLDAYPATYIWHAYPRQQKSYYSAFFWGNGGAFYPSNIFYGFHPYPDWESENQHYWEIASPPGVDLTNNMHVVYDRWYVQVAICRITDNRTVHEFYWDWPDKNKVLQYTSEIYKDPPKPVLSIGDAPWNQGREVWDGVLRGFQFYDKALSQIEIEQEIKIPGSVWKPWYLNLNPLPEDINDKSGNGNHPEWVGTERPFLWQGLLRGGNAIKSIVSPR